MVVLADGSELPTRTVIVASGARYQRLAVDDLERFEGAGVYYAATDLEAPFYALVRPLLQKAWRRRAPLRLVSVRFSGIEDGPAQLEMFAESDEKRRRLAGVLDRLNDRGRSPVVRHGHQLGTGRASPPRS